jgi:hypothetical protein
VLVVCVANKVAESTVQGLLRGRCVMPDSFDILIVKGIARGNCETKVEVSCDVRQVEYSEQHVCCIEQNDARTVLTLTF